MKLANYEFHVQLHLPKKDAKQRNANQGTV